MASALGFKTRVDASLPACNRFLRFNSGVTFDGQHGSWLHYLHARSRLMMPSFDWETLVLQNSFQKEVLTHLTKSTAVTDSKNTSLKLAIS